MKRLMMLVAMMAFVLLLPMNVEAAGETVIDGDWVIEEYTSLDKDTIVNGDVYVNNYLGLKGYSLQVNGDMYVEGVWGELNLEGSTLKCSGSIYAACPVEAEGSVFEVGGDYVQISDGLDGGYSDSGIMSVGGDFRLQGMNDQGEYIVGDGYISGSDMLQINIDGNLYIDTSTTYSYPTNGVFYVKGDVEVKTVGDCKTETIKQLHMVGDKQQKLDLPSYVTIYGIYFTNPDIKVCNYLNGWIKTDMTQITLENGILRTTDLRIDHVNVIVPGDLYAEGNLNINDWDFDPYNPVLCSFIIEGDLVQMANSFSVSCGRSYENISILGDLRIQSIDENGNYKTGSGKLLNYGNTLNIGGDIIIDTTENMRDEVSGTLYVAGDITQLSHTVFLPDHVILNGTEPQSVTLLRDTAQISTQSMIDTLELTQERKYYTFNPEPCWNKLIQLEGIRNTAEGFKYYEDGNWISDAYKYVEYDGATFLVANGVVATGVNGIAQDPLNPQDWYFLSGGQVQEQHTGLAEYDGQWFYVENGKLDTTMNQCIEYDGALFMLAEGRIISETSGLVMDPKTGNWYFLADGQAKTEYTGLASYDEKWFYIVKGILAEDYTGKVKYDGQYFNVVNGMVK